MTVDTELPIPVHYKDPEAQLPIFWDWSNYRSAIGLDPTTPFTITIPTGLTLVGTIENIPARRIDVTISGGTLGKVYELKCKALLADGDFDTRRQKISIVKR